MMLRLDRWIRSLGLAAFSCLAAGAFVAQNQPATPKPDVAALERSCEAGSTHDCLLTGLAYSRGTGVRRDSNHALALFLRACDLGDASGCSAVSGTYRYGQVVTKNRALGVKYAVRACDLGYARECLDLASQYERGYDLPKDHQRARELLQEGCDKDPTWACTEGGMDVVESRFQLDIGFAISLLQQGCDHHNASSCSKLADLYTQGKFVELNLGRGVDLHRAACENKDPKADLDYATGRASGCVGLAKSYETGKGLQKSETKAFSLYRTACSLEWDWGCDEAGHMADTSRGTKRDPALAAELLATACKRARVTTCERAGDLNLEVHPGDFAGAMELWRAGCETVDFAGDPSSCIRLGEARVAGRGGHSDDRAAARDLWYACHAGLAEGCAKLRETCSRIKDPAGEGDLSMLCRKADEVAAKP